MGEADSSNREIIAADARSRALIKTLEDLTRELRDIRHSIEEGVENMKSQTPEVNQIFMKDVESKHTIHLAFMDPSDPRPTCWDHTGIGGKFTITNHQDHVTCKKCLKVIAQNS